MSTVSKVLSAAPLGYQGALIEVESDMTRGLPGFQVVGLGNKAIDEAKERVRSAITNSLLEFPSKKITVNLAPAKLPKDGTLYDLPIALSVLVASGQIRQNEVDGALFAGELSLDGHLRPASGAINIAEVARDNQISTIYLPLESAVQATLVPGVDVYGVRSLKELFLHLKHEKPLIPTPTDTTVVTKTSSSNTFDDIYGQEQAKRALTIAVAGRHNILLSGPPGAGKTMLAQTLPGLMPELSAEERLASTKIYSLAGEILDSAITSRPFRAPHHSASAIAIIGGGSKPRPGEVSLAHGGVLFLDEIPEYPRHVLESLRQPLEDKQVVVSRAGGHATYPADFMLVATQNPCPCGYYGDPDHECSCTMMQILNYQKKLSGPLLDRIDMVIQLSPVPHQQLLAKRSTVLKNTQHISTKKRIEKAREVQFQRYNSRQKYNVNLSSKEIAQANMVENKQKTFLDQAAAKLKLSARSYFKVIRVARTIADIDGDSAITERHLAEALQYRITS